MRYAVHLVLAVSTTVEVEADSIEDAKEKAFDSPDMPGTMGHGAFGQASVDEAGDWEPIAIYDASDYDKVLWEETDR